jgi:hypothetical protein
LFALLFSSSFYILFTREATTELASDIFLAVSHLWGLEAAVAQKAVWGAGIVNNGLRQAWNMTLGFSLHC